MRLAPRGAPSFSQTGDDRDGHDYPDGQVWEHGRQLFTCSGYPRGDPTPFPNFDLVFEIEFCQPSLQDRRNWTRNEQWCDVERVQTRNPIDRLNQTCLRVNSPQLDK